MHTFEENVKLTVGLEPTATRTDEAANGGYVDMAKFNNCAAVIQQAGATTAQGAVTYTLQEGTNSTQFSTVGLATVTIASATTDQVDVIEVRAEEMTDDYVYLRVTATPAAGTANAIGVTMQQFNPRFAPV